MKRHSAIGLVFICMFQSIHAQDGAKLNVPVSPAFSILGFEPSAVMRPTNTKSLATDVLSSFDKDGKLLMNLGLEVAPYWLKNHPKLTRKTYLNPNPGQAFMQSLSISAGTAKDSATGSNKLGAGFRFRLSNGRPVAALEAAEYELSKMDEINLTMNNVRNSIEEGDTKKSVIDDLARKLKNEVKLDEKVINSIKSRANELAGKFGETEEELGKFLKALINDRDSVVDYELKKKCLNWFMTAGGLFLNLPVPPVIVLIKISLSDLVFGETPLTLFHLMTSLH